MTPLPHIELLAPRQEDLQARYPDYLIYAGERLVGRIYCQVGGMGRTEQWYWGVQGAFTSMEIGPLHGHAPSFDHAKGAAAHGVRSMARLGVGGAALAFVLRQDTARPA